MIPNDFLSYPNTRIQCFSVLSSYSAVKKWNDLQLDSTVDDTSFERDIFNHEKIQNQKFDQDLKNLVQDQLPVRKQNRHFHQKNDWYHHHKGENENQIKMIVILKVMKKKMRIHLNRKNKR